MSKITIPYLNPVKFHKLTPDETAKYLTRHMDDWNFSNTVPAYQIKQNYYQPFQTSDSLELQLESSFTAHTAKIVDGCGVTVQTLTMVQGAESASEPGLFIYEISQSLAAIEPGKYYITINCNDELVLVSEPLEIKVVHEYSICIEYSHSQNKDGLIFETGKKLELRVGGHIFFKEPASKDTSYEDQSFDTTNLDSVPYRIYELYVGGSTGIPPYLIDKINRILGCNSVKIEGIYFAKPEGAKLEAIVADDYTLKGWTVDLQESENQYSFEFSNDTTPTPTPPTVLPTPVITFSYISSSQLSVTWVAIANADSYTLLMGTINDRAFATVVSSGTNTYYPATGLQPGKRYYFWLRAEGSGLYAPSLYATANEITSAAPPTPITLSSPTPFTLVANGDGEIDANWTAVADADSYEYYLNDTNSFDPLTIQYAGTGTSKNVTGLVAGTTYYGWARAIGNGTTYLTSPYATANATTDPVDPTTKVFNTILTNDAGTSAKGAGVNAYFIFVFFSSNHKEFQFDALTNNSQNNIRLSITVGGSGAAVIDFPGNYAGQPYRYIHSTGTAYTGTFPTANAIQPF
jgi:hypothetical protein